MSRTNGISVLSCASFLKKDSLWPQTALLEAEEKKNTERMTHSNGALVMAFLLFLHNTQNNIITQYRDWDSG